MGRRGRRDCRKHPSPSRRAHSSFNSGHHSCCSLFELQEGIRVLERTPCQNAIKERQPIPSSRHMLTKFASAWSEIAFLVVCLHQAPMTSPSILPSQETGPFHSCLTILRTTTRKLTRHEPHHGRTMGSPCGQTRRK